MMYCILVININDLSCIRHHRFAKLCEVYPAVAVCVCHFDNFVDNLLRNFATQAAQKLFQLVLVQQAVFVVVKRVEARV